MESYRKYISFFSYIFGFIALIAVLVDDKKNKLYSFHIWQAFLLNIFLMMIEGIYFGLYIPQTIKDIEADSRASFFLQASLIPLILTVIVLCILAISAYKEKHFKVPLLANLASKISKYKERQDG